jgi:hypothetical protein
MKNHPKNYKKLCGYTLKQIKELCMKQNGHLPKYGWIAHNVVILPDNTCVNLCNDAGKFSIWLYQSVNS